MSIIIGTEFSGWRYWWLFLKCSLVTLYISVVTIFEFRFGKFTRQGGDQRLRWWSSKLLEYIDLKYELHNTNHFEFKPNHPYIIMCNHTSLFDIPLTFMAFKGSIRMLAKKELFSVPVWGKGMELGEFVSIDRFNRGQALKDLQKAREKMGSGIILWIAPEGTRSRNGKLQPFKKGGFVLALETGATIIPLAIRGAEEVMPYGKSKVYMHSQVELYVGQPIDARNYKPEDRNLLIEDVRKVLQSLLGEKYRSDDISAQSIQDVADPNLLGDSPHNTKSTPI